MSHRVKQKIPGLIRSMKVGDGFRIKLPDGRVIEVVYYRFRGGSQISMVANCPKDIVIDNISYETESDNSFLERSKSWKT